MDLFDLSDWLSDCADDSKKEIEKSLQDSVIKIQYYCQQEAPEDTGNLKSMISKSVFWEGKECIGRVSSDAEYSAFVCYGTGIYNTLGAGREIPWKFPYHGSFRWTSGQKPNDYMERGWNKVADDVFQILVETVDRLMK